MMINVINIHKTFGQRVIIENLSLYIRAGESIALFGPNGCGKSTLMRIMLGLDQDFEGEIQDPLGLLKNLSYLPQQHKLSLLPWLSAKENIVLPLKLKKCKTLEITRSLSELLKILPATFDLETPASKLSGGEAQTACLLRALITKPSILFLDEPTANLDYFAVQRFLENMKIARETFGTTIMSVVHDPYHAEQLADRIYVLSERPCGVLRETDRMFVEGREFGSFMLSRAGLC